MATGATVEVHRRPRPSLVPSASSNSVLPRSKNASSPGLRPAIEPPASGCRRALRDRWPPDPARTRSRLVREMNQPLRMPTTTVAQTWSSQAFSLPPTGNTVSADGNPSAQRWRKCLLSYASFSSRRCFDYRRRKKMQQGRILQRRMRGCRDRATNQTTRQKIRTTRESAAQRHATPSPSRPRAPWSHSASRRPCQRA